jgi:hypothetical protein
MDMNTPDVKKRPGHKAEGAVMDERTGKQMDAALVQSEPSSHQVRDILLKIFYLEGCKRLSAVSQLRSTNDC